MSLQLFKDTGYLHMFAREDFEALLPHCTILPAINQLEISPWLYRPVTVRYFQERGVLLQSFRTLQQGRGLSDATVCEIANNCQRTPAQV